MNSNPSKFINGVVVGAISTVIFIVILTITGDLYAPLTALLQEHYHHWVAKGIWATILFIIVIFGYYVVKKVDTNDATIRLVRMLGWALLLGALGLFLFFTYEFFGH